MAEQKLLASYRPDYPNKLARKDETLDIKWLYDHRFYDYVEIGAVRMYIPEFKYLERNKTDGRLIREYVFIAYYDDTKITLEKLTKQLEGLGCDILPLTKTMGANIINNYTSNRIEDGKVVMREQTEITDELDIINYDPTEIEEIDGKTYLKIKYLEI